ncbi:hypothetical protein PRZ61_10900 [Halomonas pacifica]|uniref:hypothetical protein n=1 Tax=Bisbaumannia pacifica TaxID=77098 RepID=UPI002358FEB1|nr:hypothetical protein [Halomonas pacifica]MDC8803944.1 hypothetical protein [Halomonas pacifica]
MSAMLLEAFNLIARGRRHLAGMSGAAKLPLSLHEINPYLDRFEPPIPEREFIRSIIRMDNVVMEHEAN